MGKIQVNNTKKLSSKQEKGNDTLFFMKPVRGECIPVSVDTKPQTIPMYKCRDSEFRANRSHRSAVDGKR